MAIWREIELAEISDVRAGSPAPQGAEYFDPNGVPFVRVQDVGRHGRTTCLTETKDQINQHAIDTFRPAFAKAGTIVFPKSGAAINTNSRAILGIDAYVVSHLAMITAKEGIVLPEWIYFWFCSFDLASLSRTTSLPSVRLSDIKKLKIPVPELAEQRRIVARIKECMERVEEIEGLRAEAIEEVDALVQSVLHDTWQSDEIISAEKMALGELGQITTGNTPSRKKPEFFGGSQPWVTPGDFNGRLIATGRECLSEQGIKEGRARVVPEASVLVVCIGATIGKVALAVRDLGINQQINAVTFDKEKVLPEYGYWACRALVPEIIGNASKNTLPILNKGKFSKLQIPVPSLYIQEQVSSKLDAVEAAVSEMRQDLSESNTASTAFRDSILRKAFAGEL